MSDIFVSYAKTDRPLALKLAAMLAAEGSQDSIVAYSYFTDFRRRLFQQHRPQADMCGSGLVLRKLPIEPFPPLAFPYCEL